MQLNDFLQRLNTVFVPSTVLMQINAGLDAYVPTIPAGLAGKPATVPDETAVLFWETQQAYRDGFATLAVRTYTLTHQAVYTPTSGADFPVAFTGQLMKDQPYFLVDRPADWMAGEVRHFLGARSDRLTPAAFRAALAQEAGFLAEAGLTGAIVCAGDEYVAIWTLQDTEKAIASTQLESLCGWKQEFAATPTVIDVGLWQPWPGLALASGDSINAQFHRRPGA